MNSKIEYLPVNKNHIDEAVKMIITAYHKEREFTPILPDDDFSDCLHNAIGRLFTQRTGLAAFHRNRLVGFLTGFPVEKFHGTRPGIYCPIFGHGAVEENRIEIYRGLYQQSADLWVEKGLCTHAITMFSHDQDLVDVFFWQGFGLRCIDAIRKTSTIDVQNSTIRIMESTLKDAEKLSNLHAQLTCYLHQSPMFMIFNKDIDEVQRHIEFFQEKNCHEWVAYKNGAPVGFIKIAPTAETFISDHPSVMNIKGFYVIESERKTGVGTLLFNTVQKWLLANKYPLCGVDYESINPLGSRFWMKYFTPYTYSLVRKIDERI